MSATRRASSPLPCTSRTAPRSSVTPSTTKVKGRGPEDGSGGFGCFGAMARLRFIPSSSRTSHTSGCSMRTQLEVHRLADQREEPDPDLEQVHVGHPLALGRLEGDVAEDDVAALDLQRASGRACRRCASLAACSPRARTRAEPAAGLHVDQPAADQQEDRAGATRGHPEHPAQPPAPAGRRRHAHDRRPGGCRWAARGWSTAPSLSTPRRWRWSAHSGPSGKPRVGGASGPDPEALRVRPGHAPGGLGPG